MTNHWKNNLSSSNDELFTVEPIIDIISINLDRLNSNLLK